MIFDDALADLIQAAEENGVDYRTILASLEKAAQHIEHEIDLAEALTSAEICINRN